MADAFVVADMSIFIILFGSLALVRSYAIPKHSKLSPHSVGFSGRHYSPLLLNDVLRNVNSFENRMYKRSFDERSPESEEVSTESGPIQD